MDAMRELTTISSGDQMVLTGLALLDATSMGTLALPAVLLLMSGRSRGVSARGIALRVLAYLAVIAVSSCWRGSRRRWLRSDSCSSSAPGRWSWWCSAQDWRG